jgi:uncharacterized protein (TIGR02757 family)
LKQPLFAAHDPLAFRDFLDAKVDLYNRVSFIGTDPVSIPHRFTKKEDIEIAGFLAATIAWGQRTTIIRNALQLMQHMDEAPHDFIREAGVRELKRLDHFVHRTFNGTDARCFILALRHIYKKHGGLETVFNKGLEQQSMHEAISYFRSCFFEPAHPQRTEKHVSDPLQGSAAKRIHMYLRWMVRRDKRGVDFGLWKTISPAVLCCPLDVHSARVARKLGLLQRTQNDRKAVEELTANLRLLDPRDPVKYDFALFGLGVFEKF